MYDTTTHPACMLHTMLDCQSDIVEVFSIRGIVGNVETSIAAQRFGCNQANKVNGLDYCFAPLKRHVCCLHFSMIAHLDALPQHIVLMLIRLLLSIGLQLWMWFILSLLFLLVYLLLVWLLKSLLMVYCYCCYRCCRCCWYYQICWCDDTIFFARCWQTFFCRTIQLAGTNFRYLSANNHDFLTISIFPELISFFMSFQSPISIVSSTFNAYLRSHAASS